MAIIKKYNKDNNTTYVYDSVSYWDKEKQQPRSRRKLIGKIDPETGEIVPTAGRGRKPKTSTVGAEDIEAKVSTNNMDDKSSGDTSAGTDISAMYANCRSELLRTQAMLTIAESRISALSAERDVIARQLERILQQLKN